MQEVIVDVIKKEIEKKEIKVIKIILFGSRAKGNFKPDSDWDVYVIIDKDITIDEKWEIILNIKRCLAKLKIPNDIIINSQREVEEKRNKVSYLTYYVLREGIEI